MRQELEALGADPAVAAPDAQVCVVNTCTVTNQADADARRFIRRIQRENPGLKVVVAGCSSALDPDVYKVMDGVVAVVEGHDPFEVARATLGSEEGAGCHPPFKGSGEGNLVQIGSSSPTGGGSERPSAGGLLHRRAGGTRGWLKVQDGCDRKCSFCATRLARGESRSRPVDEVVAEAKILAGVHPELVVTGIHIGHYGLDLEGGQSLSRLVAALLEQVPDVRFRLGSIEATEVDDLLIDLMETSGGWLAPHLHMPLQSGSDSVLRRMRRWHSREMYRTRALEIVDRFPVLGLGADVITGFPGESPEDHGSTKALLEELPFTYLHVFPFSPRNGTPALDLPQPVPQRVAGERGRELRELALRKGEAYRARRAGSEAAVVLEGGGGWALTEDYLRVEVMPRLPDAEDRPEKLFMGRLHGSGEHLSIDLSQEKMD